MHLDKFIKDIEACMDVDHLKEIRYHVIAEIVQAAHIERCKQQINRGAYPRGLMTELKLKH